MLDRPVPLSRPRPPSRKSASSATPWHSAPAPCSPSPHVPPSQPHQGLSDSALSCAARLLQERLPPGARDFKACASLVEAFFQDDPPSERLTDLDLDPDLPPPLSLSHAASDTCLSEPQPISLDWVAQKTRAELEDLLLAADRVIRERERDLGIAASIGKSLLENNIALRARQEVMLSQVSPDAAYPSPSSPSSRRHRVEDLGNCSEYIEARPPPSPSQAGSVFFDPSHCSSRFDQPSPPPRMRTLTSSLSKRSLGPLTPTSQQLPQPDRPRPTAHPSSSSSISSISSDFFIQKNNLHRQTPSSVSPAALQRLAEQNEYLSGRLASLETETAESEAQGRKRLRKLVRELDALRVDLRHTEERNALLEEERATIIHQHSSSISGVGEMVDELVDGMKRIIMEDHSGDPLSSESSTFPPPRVEKKECPGTGQVDGTHHEQPDSSETTAPLLPLPSGYCSSSMSCLSLNENLDKIHNPVEKALISQLLKKILELKDCQLEFEGERETMKQRLLVAQEEVESMRILVEAAETELNEARQLNMEHNSDRLLIGWDGAMCVAEPDSDTNADGRFHRRAPGNQSMIQKQKIKSNKKIHWPAVDRRTPGNYARGLTPLSPQSVESRDYFQRELESPSLQGKPLSISFATPTPIDEDEHAHQLRVLRSVGAVPGSSSIGSEYDDTDSLAGIRGYKSPPLSGYQQPGDCGYEVGEIAHSLFDEEGSLGDDPPSLARSSSPSDSLVLPSRPRVDPRGTGLPLVHRHHRDLLDEHSYADFQRAVAELPVVWADEVGEPTGMKPNAELVGGALTRKRDSTGWLVDPLGDSGDVNEWSPLVSPDSLLPGLSSNDRDVIEPHNCRRPLLLKQHDHQGHKGRRIKWNKKWTSTVSDSTLSTARDDVHVQEMSCSSPTELSGQMLNRREQALRRLGIQNAPEKEGSSSTTVGAHSVLERGQGKDEDGDDEEVELNWKYVDSTDHDNCLQGSRGTDYFPISLSTRNSPGMVVERVKVESTQVKLALSQWAKLATVLGLAVGWAVWQGPKVLKDWDLQSDQMDSRKAIEDNKEQVDEGEGGGTSLVIPD